MKVMGHKSCMKSMSRTITIQGFILTAITAAVKCTLVSRLEVNFDKVIGA